MEVSKCSRDDCATWPSNSHPPILNSFVLLFVPLQMALDFTRQTMLVIIDYQP